MLNVDWGFLFEAVDQLQLVTSSVCSSNGRFLELRGARLLIVSLGHVGRLIRCCAIK